MTYDELKPQLDSEGLASSLTEDGIKVLKSTQIENPTPNDSLKSVLYQSATFDLACLELDDAAARIASCFN